MSEPKASYKVMVARDVFQREVRLGALNVFVTEIPKDGLGYRGVSLCVMDSFQQLNTVRFDMLPDAARVLADLLLRGADRCEQNERIEELEAGIKSAKIDNEPEPKP